MGPNDYRKTRYVGVAQLNDGEYIFTGSIGSKGSNGSSDSIEDAMIELDKLVKQSHPGGTPRKVGVVSCYDADFFSDRNEELEHDRYMPSKGGYKGGYFNKNKNFSDKLMKCFSDSKLDIVIWIDGSGKVHEDKFSYDECSKEASKRYITPVDQLTDLDIVGKFLYESYPRYRITPFLKILKDGDNKDEVIKELKSGYNKKS